MFIWARILSKSFQVCILNQIVSAMNRYVINRLCVFVLSDYLKGRGEALLPLDGCLSLGVRGLPLVTSLPLVTGRPLVGSSSSCSSTAPTYTPAGKTRGSSDQLDCVNTSKEDLGSDKGCYRLKWCRGRVWKRQGLGWDQHDAQQGYQSSLKQAEIGFVSSVVSIACRGKRIVFWRPNTNDIWVRMFGRIQIYIVYQLIF